MREVRRPRNDEHNPNLAEAFLRTAGEHRSATAFMQDHRHVNYGELRNLVEAFALQLTSQRDWRPRTRVAIRLPNSPEYAVAFYGTLLAGGVVVPIPMEQTSRWTELVLEATQTRWLAEPAHSESSSATLRNVVQGAGSPEPLDIPGNLAAIFFTSGSSGTPKGVMLSHRNLLANAESIRKSLPLQTKDRALAVLPFCHAYGNSVLQTHLLSGATLVVAGSATFPATLMDAMQRHSVTSFAGVPDLYRLLLPSFRAAKTTLRYLTVAGGALRPEITRECAELLNPAELFVMYGQTEATARLSCLPASQLANHCGSIGRGIPGVALAVVNEKGVRIRPGELGEIRAAGPNTMLGYWNDPESTSRILRDGWLYTGDLATVDDEGYIYPKGRTSQLLKIGGYRLHPAEVETIIAREFPTIEPVVVPFDTADHFTKLALFLLPLRPGVTPDTDKVRTCCRRLLARHQRPDLINFLDVPPLTASLKIDRLRLSAIAAETAAQRLAAHR